MIAKIKKKNEAKERRQQSLVSSHLEREAKQQRWLYQRKICQIIAIISAAVSANYATVLWLAFDSGWGAIFDYSFCVLHLCAFYWIKRKQYTLSAYWTLIMVALQVAGGVALFVGPETGFQYYLFCLPAVVYMILQREPWWRKFALVLVGFGMLVISEQVSFPSMRANISTDTQTLMYYINLTLVVIINFFSIKFFADEAKSQYRKQKQLILSDSLTGLSNRRYIMQFAYKLFALCERYEHPISVIMLDVDYFKNVNDQYGHQAGDDALQRVADCLRNNIRAADVAARYGGEEFLVLLPETDLLTAEDIAERIRDELAKTTMDQDSAPFSITASFGVSCSDHVPTRSADALIKQADDALYEAKHAGRNCVKVAYESELVG